MTTIYVKGYTRRRHGRANFGGMVKSHDRNIKHEFNTLTNVVEMSQGPFKVKPKLWIKPWKYATNHTLENNSGKPVKASVVIDKTAARDPGLRKFLELHELRENQLIQHGLAEKDAHPIAMSFAEADRAALGLPNPDERALKTYKKIPNIFTDKELDSLKSKQMFPAK